MYSTAGRSFTEFLNVPIPPIYFCSYLNIKLKDIYEQIKEIAEKEDRSFSQQVNRILKEFIEKSDK